MHSNDYLNAWEEFHSGRIDYDTFVTLLSRGIFIESGKLDKTDKRKFKKAGFSDIDISFMEHLNYVLSASDRGIGESYKFLEGNYNHNGRMLTKKCLNGHMNTQELYNVLYKFKKGMI